MGLTGEIFNHKIAGIFKDARQLDQCRDRLVDEVGTVGAQARTLRPGDQVDGAVLEPESRGIWLTLIRAHVWLALAGAVAGVLVFGILYALGVAFVVQNAWAAALLLMFFSAVGGGLLGGAVTLRPDHTPYLVKVQAALRDDRHVLLLHLDSQEQLAAVKSCLDACADETVATL
ncbi:MAG: hypothetical protein EA370_01425 [Wenzhouxiangella sp.]|nr:MAG: hypothetical protein EA370_01425 [Wenzhouxiangella sp.]